MDKFQEHKNISKKMFIITLSGLIGSFALKEVKKKIIKIKYFLPCSKSPKILKIRLHGIILEDFFHLIRSIYLLNLKMFYLFKIIPR